MRLILMIALLLGHFTTIQAEEKKDPPKKMVKVRTKKSKPLILMEPKLDIIPLEAIKFSTGKLQRSEVESRLRSGGDDVGNGGDEIRRQILDALPELSTKNIAVVSNLSFNEETEVAIHSTEGILLNREVFQELISKKLDFRFTLLEVLHVGDRNKALDLYSDMKELGKRTPYCQKEPSQYKFHKTEFSDTIKGEESTVTLSDLALIQCEERGLYECRIKETGRKGFASSAKNFATYIGFKIEKLKKSKTELKESRCLLLKKCEEVFELAPIGQITMEAFDKLELEIQKQCF